MFPMFNDSCKFMQGIRKRIKMLVFSDGGKNHIQNQKKTKKRLNGISRLFLKWFRDCFQNSKPLSNPFGSIQIKYN